MPIYEITDPSKGLTLKVDAERAPTDDEAQEIIYNYRMDGLSRLAQREQWSRGNRRDKDRKEKIKSGVVKDIEQSLGIGSGSFDIENGMPLIKRAVIDFLPTESDKVYAMQEQYGRENVTALTVRGDRKIVYRDPESNKWRFLDKFGLDIGDVTSDISGDIIPTSASIASGLAASSSGPFGMALSGGAGHAVSGGIQDVAARGIAKLTGNADQINLKEIAKRRAIEGALVTAIDYSTMKLGKFVLGVIGKEGADLSTAELKRLAQDGIDAPPYMLRGEKSAETATALAHKYPKSKVAKTLEEKRDNIAKRAQALMSGSDEALESGYKDAVRSIREDGEALNAALEKSVQSRKAATEAARESKQATASESKRALNEAKEEVAILERQKIDNLGGKSNFSPDKDGSVVQSRLMESFVKNKIQSGKLYDEASELIGDTATTYGSFMNRISRSIRMPEVIRDLEDEIISEVSPAISSRLGKAVNKMEDIADMPMSFAEVNAMLQSIRSRVPYTGKGTLKSGATPDARAAHQAAKSIEALRDSLLNKASPEARNAFKRAQDFYRETILPYDLRRPDSILRLEPGENINAYTEALLKGKPLPVLRFENGGLEALRMAIQSPQAVRQTLKASGNDMTVKKALRQAWLDNKGLTPNSPLDKVRFSAEDYDMAKVLWDHKKVDALKRLQKFSYGKDALVEGLSARKFNDLVNANYDDALKAAEKAAREELSAKSRLKKFMGNRIYKAVMSGDMPDPSSKEVRRELASYLLDKNFSRKEIMKFHDKLGKGGRAGLEKALFEVILRRSSGGTDWAQQTGLKGFWNKTLWDGKRMADNLKQKEHLLRKIWGDDRYESLVRLNDGFARLSVQRPKVVSEAQTVQGNVATSLGGGISFFFTNIPKAIKEKIILSVWGSEMLGIPKAVGGFKTQADFDSFLEKTLRSLFLTNQGIRALLDETDDPEFKQWVREQMFQEPTQ